MDITEDLFIEIEAKERINKNYYKTSNKIIKDYMEEEGFPRDLIDYVTKS